LPHITVATFFPLNHQAAGCFELCQITEPCAVLRVIYFAGEDIYAKLCGLQQGFYSLIKGIGDAKVVSRYLDRFIAAVNVKKEGFRDRI